MKYTDFDFKVTYPQLKGEPKSILEMGTFVITETVCGGYVYVHIQHRDGHSLSGSTYILESDAPYMSTTGCTNAVFEALIRYANLVFAVEPLVVRRQQRLLEIVDGVIILLNLDSCRNSVLSEQLRALGDIVADNALSAMSIIKHSFPGIEKYVRKTAYQGVTVAVTPHWGIEEVEFDFSGDYNGYQLSKRAFVPFSQDYLETLDAAVGEFEKVFNRIKEQK